MINRRVRVIGNEEGASAEPRRFSDFTARPNIVLLGDPGSGKTHLFKDFAATAAEAHYLKARIFQLLPAAELGATLFIDALDEQRGGSRDNSAIDAMVPTLFERRPERVRIACREQDWLGDTDLAALNAYFDRNGGVTVLRLEPISFDEQIEILVAHGATPDAARAFIGAAEQRGLDALLRNPQKLRMLHSVVERGSWPATLFDLFRRATDLQLEEKNPDHARLAGGAMSAAQLRPVAGAICAARLISDVDGICLAAGAATPLHPSYRDLALIDEHAAYAALRRPLFIAAGPAECVDYDHRTSAEFLAAEYIAIRVRDGGLPLSRMQALIGVDGHPAAELRGLHAWLPHHLPEHARIFIEADPLGVLEYGDAASLSAQARAALLEALARLAADNPWFLGRNRRPAGIGALAQPDNIEALCALVGAHETPRDLRTLALEAIAAAAPHDGAFDLLSRVLGNDATYLGDRLTALDALLAFGARGRDAVLRVDAKLTPGPANNVSLHARIIERLYGDGYGSDAVVELVRDLLVHPHDTSVGLLWSLADAIPVADLIETVDRLVESIPHQIQDTMRRGAYDAASFVNRAIKRVLGENAEALAPERALAWAELRRRISRVNIDERDAALPEFIRARPELARGTFNRFVDQYAPDPEHPGRWSRRFFEIIAPLAEREELCSWCCERAEAESEAERRIFAFELAAGLCQTGTPRGGDLFERVYALGQADALLGARHAPYLVSHLDHWQARSERADEREREREEHTAATRAEFAANADAIRKGTYGGLHFAADIYFDMFHGLEHDTTPEARLTAYFGEANAEAILAGFEAFSRAEPAPPLDEILSLRQDGKYMVRWRTLAAGADVLLAKGDDGSALSDQALSAVLLLDLYDGLSRRIKAKGQETPFMQEALKETRPDIAAPVYLRAVEFDLARGEEHVTGLYEFLREDLFRPLREEHLLDLLDRHKDMRPRNLEEMLGAALGSPPLRAGLAERATRALQSNETSERARPLWLSAAYLLNPEDQEEAVAGALALDRNTSWALRDFLGYESRQPYELWPLTEHDLAFLISINGRHWPPADHPKGGWSGNTNPWDASEFVRRLIDRLSASPTAAATAALDRLVADTAVAAYSAYLLSARAQQRVLRREAAYARPEWSGAIEALANRAPASAADLHALVVEQLRSAATVIDGSNEDRFKQFWNEDGYGRPISPKSEESCRDVLVTMLRPWFAPLGLTVEPEGHMSANKRVDIAIARPGLKCVIEVKLGHSPDLWTAMASQLDHLYTRDPETGGHGVLLVVWFGEKGPPVTADGDGLRSGTPGALAAALQQGAADERLVAAVIDVSGRR